MQKYHTRYQDQAHTEGLFASISNSSGLGALGSARHQHNIVIISHGSAQQRHGYGFHSQVGGIWITVKRQSVHTGMDDRCRVKQMHHSDIVEVRRYTMPADAHIRPSLCEPQHPSLDTHYILTPAGVVKAA